MKVFNNISGKIPILNKISDKINLSKVDDRIKGAVAATLIVLGGLTAVGGVVAGVLFLFGGPLTWEVGFGLTVGGAAAGLLISSIGFAILGGMIEGKRSEVRILQEKIQDFKDFENFENDREVKIVEDVNLKKEVKESFSRIVFFKANDGLIFSEVELKNKFNLTTEIFNVVQNLEKNLFDDVRVKSQNNNFSVAAKVPSQMSKSKNKIESINKCYAQCWIEETVDKELKICYLTFVDVFRGNKHIGYIPVKNTATIKISDLEQKNKHSYVECIKYGEIKTSIKEAIESLGGGDPQDVLEEQVKAEGFRIVKYGHVLPICAALRQETGFKRTETCEVEIRENFKKIFRLSDKVKIDISRSNWGVNGDSLVLDELSEDEKIKKVLKEMYASLEEDNHLLENTLSFIFQDLLNDLSVRFQENHKLSFTLNKSVPEPLSSGPILSEYNLDTQDKDSIKITAYGLFPLSSFDLPTSYMGYQFLSKEISIPRSILKQEDLSRNIELEQDVKSIISSDQPIFKTKKEGEEHFNEFKRKLKQQLPQTV